MKHNYFRATFPVTRQSVPTCVTDWCEPWCATVNALEGNIYRNIHLEWNWTPLNPSVNLIFGSGSEFFYFFLKFKRAASQEHFPIFPNSWTGSNENKLGTFSSIFTENQTVTNRVCTPEDDRMFPENNQFSNKKGVLESCP